MATTSERPAVLLEPPRREAPATTSKVQPVVWWAALGALIVAFMSYVLIKWVTGPYFEHVSPGASDIPPAQEIALLGIQIGGCALVAFIVYRTLVRPWRRERRVASEGLLILAYGTLYFQDPFSNANNYWFHYNDHLFNMGSWVNELPLFTAWGGEPGAMWSEPIFGMGPGYIYFWVIGVWAGTLAFRFVKRRFPRVGLPGAILACYAAIFLFDVVLEGFVWMRTGFFVYPGARWATLFGDSYLAYPFIEAALIGVLLIPFVLMRYYRDDRGYTFVERGIDKVRTGFKTKVVLRFLALLAISHVFFFFAYNIWAYQIGVNATAYQTEVLERSHFLHGLCGGGTDRACPGPAVPNSRDRSTYINTEGRVGTPEGTELPATVPNARGGAGPAE